jgi:hypothetical protein
MQFGHVLKVHPYIVQRQECVESKAKQSCEFRYGPKGHQYTCLLRQAPSNKQSDEQTNSETKTLPKVERNDVPQMPVINVRGKNTADMAVSMANRRFIRSCWKDSCRCRKSHNCFSNRTAMRSAAADWATNTAKVPGEKTILLLLLVVVVVVPLGEEGWDGAEPVA